MCGLSRAAQSNWRAGLGSVFRCLLLLCWSGACLKLVRVSGFEDSRAYVDVVDQTEFCREENEKVLSCC